jgi:hypothetical protein
MEKTTPGHTDDGGVIVGSPMVHVLEHLIDKYAAPMPEGAPDGLPPAAVLQFTLKDRLHRQGCRARSDFDDVFVATCPTQDQRGNIMGMIEVYFLGSELAFIARPIEKEEPRIIGAATLPPGITRR